MPLVAKDLHPHIRSEFHAPEELLGREDTTLSHLYHWNAKANPYYPLFVYHDPVNAKLEYITYSAANEAINRAARYFTHSVGSGSNVGEETPVIGILANSGASFRSTIHDETNAEGSDATYG